MGGILFTQTLKDFQDALKQKSIIQSSEDFDYLIDDQYFALTISAKNKELKFEIDIFSGKVMSMICYKGYIGKLDNDIGIGTSIKALIKDERFGFNLDTDWFDRTPFDGLIVYPPLHLKDKCIEAALNGGDYPEFSIEKIELVDLDFAKEIFNDGTLTFE